MSPLCSFTVSVLSAVGDVARRMWMLPRESQKIKETVYRVLPSFQLEQEEMDSVSRLRDHTRNCGPE